MEKRQMLYVLTLTEAFQLAKLANYQSILK